MDESLAIDVFFAVAAHVSLWCMFWEPVLCVNKSAPAIGSAMIARVHTCIIGFRQSCSPADQHSWFEKGHEITKHVRLFNLIIRTVSKRGCCHVVGRGCEERLGDFPLHSARPTQLRRHS